MGGTIDAEDVDKWLREQRERNLIAAAVAERDERIRQLEQLNATLSAEIDRMRPVVEAAQGLVHLDVLFQAKELSRVSTALDRAVATYEASKPK